MSTRFAVPPLTAVDDSGNFTSVMSTHELIELARKVTRDAFIAQVPPRFIVLGASQSTPPGAPAISFATQAFMAPTKLSVSDELIVIPLVKAENNPYADRVSIGRARNCDIVIRDPSISKLHALVRVDGSEFALLDIGSQNGTYLNGRRLAANEPVLLSTHDQVMFGGVPTTFMDSAAVHAVLLKAIPANAS